MQNADKPTIEGFGEEWTVYDQSALSLIEKEKIFAEYFHIFPWHLLPPNAVGFDLGCGSGRWATLVAPRVGRLHCIDASEKALTVARRNLVGNTNVVFHHASVDAIPLQDGQADFGYSLGVLHHVPDTLSALRSCAKKLRPGAPFLLYLYYRFDDKPRWYVWLWQCTDALRKGVSRLPFKWRLVITRLVASSVYWPLARLAKLGAALRINTGNWPLNYYKNKSFYVMQTDALDRFGTQLEQRFRRDEIEEMLLEAGFEHARFSERPPFWCVLAYRAGQIRN